MARWGMVIDLRKCIGCGACATACKQSNRVLPNRWRKIVDHGVSEAEPRQRTFVPMSCMQCSDPPCLDVCPTKATYIRPDGIVASNYEICVGCGYCVLACPYQARSIIQRSDFVLDPEVLYEEDAPITPAPERIGVATKCNFCQAKIDDGLAKGLQPGIDPEATPECVLACTASALHFGDLDDPESNVSRLIKENKTARLQEALGTDPAVFYITE